MKILHGTAACLIETGQMDLLMDLLRGNMKELYQATGGWDEQAKQAEMFSDQARFLVAVSPAAKAGHILSNQLLGFCHYRFTEEDEDDVVYCYELQLAPKAQGLHIGSELLQVGLHTSISLKQSSSSSGWLEN